MAEETEKKFENLEQIAKELNSLLSTEPSLEKVFTTKYMCSKNLAQTKLTLSYDGRFYIDTLSIFNYLYSFYVERTEGCFYHYLAFNGQVVVDSRMLSNTSEAEDEISS